MSIQDIIAKHIPLLEREVMETYTVKRGNHFNNDINEMVLPMSELEFRLAHIEWERGAMIQDAFPNLYAEEREFIKTGITPELWNTVLGTIEIEDEHGDWADTPSDAYNEAHEGGNPPAPLCDPLEDAIKFLCSEQEDFSDTNY
jgi:hypothetical protein